MDLSISRNRRTHVQHRAGRFLRRAATYIILSTPLCGRASWTKNYVAHHGKRKVKRSVRTAASYFSFLRPRKRSKRRITLIERKTSSTSADFSIVVPLLAPSLFLFLSLFSPVQSLAHRGEIQLSPLYRDSTLRVRIRSLNASHRMIRGG